MPGAQLITSGLERALNQYIKLDPHSAALLKKLDSKQLQVTINELPFSLVFVFSQRIDLLARDKQSENDPTDCHITLSFSTLDKLRDTSQLTRLIQSGELSLDGDIHVAQYFSQMLKEIDVDWEDQLSRYTGDVVAHSVFEVGTQVLNKIKTKANAIALTLRDGALEEKNVVAHPYMVEDFCQQVNEMRSQTDRLEARLQQLESKLERS